MNINASDKNSASLLRLGMVIIFRIEIPKGEPNLNCILCVFRDSDALHLALRKHLSR
jgi:hypothetical protein